MSRSWPVYTKWQCYIPKTLHVTGRHERHDLIRTERQRVLPYRNKDSEHNRAELMRCAPWHHRVERSILLLSTSAPQRHWRFTQVRVACCLLRAVAKAVRECSGSSTQHASQRTNGCRLLYSQIRCITLFSYLVSSLSRLCRQGLAVGATTPSAGPRAFQALCFGPQVMVSRQATQCRGSLLGIV